MIYPTLLSQRPTLLPDRPSKTFMKVKMSLTAPVYPITGHLPEIEREIVKRTKKLLMLIT